MKKKINKKSLFTKLGVVLGGIALGFGIAFGIESLVNNTKNEKDLNPPLVSVENEDGIRLKQNKVSNNGSIISVTATVSPSYANNKTVSWSLAWASTNSATVSDYVSLVPSTDTLTCNVSVKKAFTTQIILTCTSNANSMAKASCTIDYVGRNLEYNPGSLPTDFDFTGENLSDYSFFDLLFGEMEFSLTSSLYSTSGGTLNNVSELENISITSYKIDDESISSSTFNNSSIEQYLVDEYGDLETAYNTTSGSLVISISLSGDVYYNSTKVGLSNSLLLSTVVYFDLTAYGPTGITLNDTSLIF